MTTTAELDQNRAMRLDHLPPALIATIMTKLDVTSICSLASTCRTFHSCASNILCFIPNFHLVDIGASIDILRPLLMPVNPYLQSMKLDCSRLDDSSITSLIRPSLQHLCLHNCADFSGKLLSCVGQICKDIRFLFLGSVAEKRGRSIDVSDLQELLTGCTQLETLVLMLDASIFSRRRFATIWAFPSTKLISLEIGFISSVMVTEMLSPVMGPNHSPRPPCVLPGLQKLCLSVDYITDTMVGMISRGLTSLTHLDLRDSPITEPRVAFDLTNVGVQQINSCGKLKHLSLVRSQDSLPTYFKRVNDLGILLMADKCSGMESITLGGFCQVTDTGFKTLLHSCANLYKLRVSRGTHLTDLIFHDITATSLSLEHVSLRWCNLLTNFAATRLACNRDLVVLDLRDCRNLGDEALRAIASLPKLKTLLVDGCDISDMGLYHLSRSRVSSLVSLSVRGCKKLTDKCISLLFSDSSNQEMRDLDVSNLPNLSDAAMLSIARSRVPLTELRMRQCPLIGDTSIMALASMKVDENGWQGCSLQLLDLFNCGGMTQVAFRWLKKPYFPRMRWLGISGIASRDVVDSLIRNRPLLHVACRGEELGPEKWDNYDDLYTHDYEEVDEFEQWLLEGSDEEMEEAQNIEIMVDNME